MTLAFDTEQELRRVLADVLGLAPGQAELFSQDSGLFGALPELDSMALAGLLTELEDRFSIRIELDEVDGELFATFGSLSTFILAKRGGG